MRILTFLVLLLSCLMPTGCLQTDKPAPRPADAVTIVTSNYPVHYMTRQLAPEHVEVLYPVPSDVDPAFWEPTSDDIEAMQAADLIMLNGAGYEKWRSWVSLPVARVIETASGFQDQWILSEDATVHSHGPGDTHTHGEVDFNTWLDPRLASLQAEAAARALKSALPEHSVAIDQRLARLKAELEHLDQLFASVAAKIGDAPLIASHPVYDYFARRYGLHLQSVHWEPDQAPSSEGWQEFDQLLDSHPARVMLWEDEPLEETAAQLRQRGIVPVVFVTAGSAPENEDYLQVMHENAERLRNAF